MTLYLSPLIQSIPRAHKAASHTILSASLNLPRATQHNTTRLFSSLSSPTQTTRRRPIARQKANTPNPLGSTAASARLPNRKRPAPNQATFSTASTIMTEPQVHELFEPVTGSWQYVVADPATSSAVIIDPVLNFDAAKGVISTESADALIDVVTERGYSVDMILETHIHADHMTSAAYIQAMLAKKQEHKPLIGIGSRIVNTQKMFGERYGISSKEYSNVFDRLWADDEEFRIGSLTARAIHLPGHTPDHMGYQIGSNVFVGDSIFYVDIGSARADFPGGSAEAVYSSGRKLLSLPDDFKIWVGHDYPPQGRDKPVPYVIVKRQREENKHLKDSVQREEFVKMRRERDETLAAPRLIHPSLQINIRGGRLPAATASGLRVVHLPLQVPDPAW